MIEIIIVYWTFWIKLFLAQDSDATIWAWHEHEDLHGKWGMWYGIVDSISHNYGYTCIVGPCHSYPV